MIFFRAYQRIKKKKKAHKNQIQYCMLPKVITILNMNYSITWWKKQSPHWMGGGWICLGLCGVALYPWGSLWVLNTWITSMVQSWSPWLPLLPNNYHGVSSTSRSCNAIWMLFSILIDALQYQEDSS